LCWSWSWTWGFPYMASLDTSASESSPTESSPCSSAEIQDSSLDYPQMFFDFFITNILPNRRPEDQCQQTHSFAFQSRTPSKDSTPSHICYYCSSSCTLFLSVTIVHKYVLKVCVDLYGSASINSLFNLVS
jgi:hypothetical protein